MPETWKFHLAVAQLPAKVERTASFSSTVKSIDHTVTSTITAQQTDQSLMSSCSSLEAQRFCFYFGVAVIETSLQVFKKKEKKKHWKHGFSQVL